MTETGDDLVCVSDSVKRGEYPTEEELDEIIHEFVKNEYLGGFDPKKLPLQDVIEVSNFTNTW